MSATTTGAVAQSKERYSLEQACTSEENAGDLASTCHRAAGVHRGRSALPCGSWSSHRSPTRMPWPAAWRTLLPKGRDLRQALSFANPSHLAGYLNTIIYSVVGLAVNMAVTIPAPSRCPAANSSRAASSCSCSPSPCSSAASLIRTICCTRPSASTTPCGVHPCQSYTT